MIKFSLGKAHLRDASWSPARCSVMADPCGMDAIYCHQSQRIIGYAGSEDEARKFLHVAKTGSGYILEWQSPDTCRVR